MVEVRLSGRLVCATEAQARVVAEQLPRHVELTRAEPGCLAFEVIPTPDPLVWTVDERFVDRHALDAHQERTAASEWGLATRGIAREYSIE